MCVTADKTLIFHKSVMNTRTKEKELFAALSLRRGSQGFCVLNSIIVVLKPVGYAVFALSLSHSSKCSHKRFCRFFRTEFPQNADA